MERTYGDIVTRAGQGDSTMKAIAIDDFGSAPSLQDVPRPTPTEGELLVRVEASSVNGFDVGVASGMAKGMVDYKLPIVLGRDFAGTVAALGPGIAGFEVGERVFGVLMKMPLHDGTFAEYAAVVATFAAKIPDGLATEVAGAIGLAGSAANAAIDAIDAGPGDTVLISGATGGVGAFAVQIAKRRGAIVIATATPEQAARVRALGADETVNHTGDLAAAVLSAHPDGVDAVVHLAGDGKGLVALFASGGRASSTLGLDPSAFTQAKITPVVAMPTTATLESLAAAVTSGELFVPIQATYTLADAPRAIDDFTKGTRGKLGITVP
jgi:NADPH2:quinone reductase